VNWAPNFSKTEFEKSATADRHGVENVIPEYRVAAVQNVARNLQIVRDLFPYSMRINSGYRSPALSALINPNTAFDSPPRPHNRRPSQHCFGEAADVEAPPIHNIELGMLLVSRTDFDKLIFEAVSPIDPQKGWIHVSYALNRDPRREVRRMIPGRNGRPTTYPLLKRGQWDEWAVSVHHHVMTIEEARETRAFNVGKE